MENLIDLYERLNESSMDLDVRNFLKAAIDIVANGKPPAQLEKLVDDFVLELDE